MRLLIDENCASSIFVGLLRAKGHSVETTISAVGAGASDASILEYAISEDRAIVTKDVEDFCDLISGGMPNPGLILIYEGRGGGRLSAQALAQALENLQSVYGRMSGMTVVLNEFLW